MSKAVPWSTEVRMIGMPDGDVDGAFEIDQLHGNVALVMVHRDHQVVGAADGLQEDGIAGVGSAAIDALGAHGLNRRAR